MEDKGQSLMSRSIIIRGLINELHEEGTITTKEKDLFNDWETESRTQSQKIHLLRSKNRTAVIPEVSGVGTFQEPVIWVMSPKIPTWDAINMELKDFQLSQEVKTAILSLSNQMHCSSEETLEMSLREYFCLPRPQKWKRESWITGGVVMEGERWTLWLNKLSDFSLSLTHSLFCIGDSHKITWSPRSPCCPWGSIRGGEDGSWITHCYKGAICIGDSSKTIWSPRSPWSPWGSIRGGEDGSFHTHYY